MNYVEEESSSLDSDTSHEYVAQLGAEWVCLKAKLKIARDKTDRAFWKFAKARKGLKRLIRKQQKEDHIAAKTKPKKKKDWSHTFFRETRCCNSGVWLNTHLSTVTIES